MTSLCNMCVHISASFVAIGEGAASHYRATYNPHTLKELAQQTCNRLLHHQP